MSDSKLYQKLQYSIDHYRTSQELRRMKENFAVAAGLFAELIAQIRRDNINYRLPAEVDNIFGLLQQEKVVAAQVSSGAVFVNLSGGARTV